MKRSEKKETEGIVFDGKFKNRRPQSSGERDQILELGTIFLGSGKVESRPLRGGRKDKTTLIERWKYEDNRVQPVGQKGSFGRLTPNERYCNGKPE